MSILGDYIGRNDSLPGSGHGISHKHVFYSIQAIFLYIARFQVQDRPSACIEKLVVVIGVWMGGG